MLFAASAGLAGLGPQLEGIRKELDSFHKPRARSTTLKLAKDRLQDLDRQRRELDITASAAQKLQRDVTAADKAWATARQAETAADAALRATATALAVLPQQARLARLRDQLAPLAALPEATEADERDLQAIEQALHGLAGQQEQRDAAHAELETRQAALLRDPAILPLAARIAEAAALDPLHQAARADLPRRRDSLAGVEADLARRLGALALAGPAADHALSPSVMARLRALVARRDVVVQAAALAQEEAEKAERRLGAAREKLGDVAPEDDLQSLAQLVARLRQSDPEAQRTRAAQDAAARNADLTNALHSLAPWRGTARDLAALAVPAPWQIETWEEAGQTAERALRTAADTVDRQRAALAAARQTTPADPRGAPSLTEAAQTRARREAAWAAHLAHLTPYTAATFETALRLDDRLTLQLAEAMAAADRAAEGALELARLTADLTEAEAALLARQADQQALAQTVADCAAGLGLAGAGIAGLRAWLALRDKALAALTAHDQAQELADPGERGIG